MFKLKSKPSISTKPLRGMRDVLPPESEEIAYLESTFRSVARLFGYREVIPPTIERFELFAVKSGEEIVKSMYSFKDKGGRLVALRPEVTASIARMYIDKLRAEPKPLRIFYLANCFRYEEPQYGRYREFRQGGIELLGAPGVEADAEPAILLGEFYSRIGLREYEIVAGNIAVYHALYEKFRVGDKAVRESLRLIDKGLVDEGVEVACKNSVDPNGLKKFLELISEVRGGVREAREVIEELEFKIFPELEVKLRELVEFASLLSQLGIPVRVDARLARGLEYYTGIIYEVKVPSLNVSIGGGGRYDGLIEAFGGPPTPATGNAIGIERTLLALKTLKTEVLKGEEFKIAVLPLEPKILSYALKVQKKLHSLDLRAEIILQRRSMGRMLSELSRRGYTHVAILGMKEETMRQVTIKDLKSKTQKTLHFEELCIEALSKI